MYLERITGISLSISTRKKINENAYRQNVFVMEEGYIKWGMNYRLLNETMSDQGRHIFHEFLCKCDLFTSRFKVPRLTGIFTEEK